jgi:hypothetical protein
MGLKKLGRPPCYRPSARSGAAAWAWGPSRGGTPGSRAEAIRQQLAGEIVNEALANFLQARAEPPAYAGPPDARVIVVADVRNDESSFPGSWLPLATPLTIQFGRALGAGALRLGWTNQAEVPPAVVRGAKGIVALGEKAHSWAKFQVGHPNVLELPHPSWLYRYGVARGQIGEVEAKLRSFVEEHG